MTIVGSTLKDGQLSASIVEKYDAIKDILVLRGIEAGPGIELEVIDADGFAGGGSKIVISNSIPPVITGESNTASNLGSNGEGLFFQKVGTELQFKRLLAGSNVTMVSDSETVTINVPFVGEVATARSLGTGAAVYDSKIGTEFRFKSLKAGSGVSIVDDGMGTLTVSTVVVAGETNTTSNLGSGVGLAAPKNGTNLPFKSLTAGPNVTLTDGPDSVMIGVNIPPTAVTKFTDLFDVPHDLYGQVGKAIVVNSTGTALEFGTLSPVAQTGDYSDLANKPVLAAVATTGNYSDLLGKPVMLTRLSDMADTNVTLPAHGEALVWDAGVSKWVNKPMAVAVGGIAALVDDTAPKLGGNLDVNGFSITSVSDLKLVAVGGVSINGINFPAFDGMAGQVLKTDGNGSLVWSSDIAGSNGEVNTASNVGIGVGLFKSKVGADLQFKSITTGSGKVSITDGDTLIVNVVEANLNLNALGGGSLGLTKGGTGATDPAGARSNLGLGSMATQAASAVAITGGTINGTTIGATTPAAITATNLTANGTVKINGLTLPSADGAAGQVMTTNGAGVLSWLSLPNNYVLKASNIVYVAKNGSDSTGDGSIGKPVATIAKALNGLAVNSVVVLFPGTYTENVNITTNGIAFVGYGAGAASRTIINGKVVVNGASDILFNDIAITNSTDLALQIYNAGPLTAFNCSMTRGANMDAIRIDGAQTGEVMLQNTNVVGIVANTNTAAGNKVVIRHSRSPLMQVQNLTNTASTSVEDCSDIGWVRHDGGVMVINGVSKIIKNISGNSIESTASLSTALLYINEVDFLQDDGSFGRINKTANCPYVVTDNNRDVANDVLAGVRRGYGRSAIDMTASYSPTNYTANDASVHSHLQGLDSKLGNLAVMTSVSQDTAPKLGGNLDVNGKTIIGDVTIRPTTKLVVDAPIALSNGYFSNNGDARTLMNVLRVQTNTSAATELYLDENSQRLVVPSNTTWMYSAKIVGRRTDAPDESAAFEIVGCVDNNGGTVMAVGEPTKIIMARDKSLWDVDAVVDDATDTLKFMVSGETGKTIRWVAFVTIVEVKN